MSGDGWYSARTIGVTLVTAAVVVVVAGALLLPSPAEIRQRAQPPSSLILDRNGQLLYEMIDRNGGAHRPVPLDEIPIAVRQAAIATEDATFYRNPGVHVRAIARAVWLNIRTGAWTSGGSTITQQLARGLLIDPNLRTRRPWPAKLLEAILALYMTAVMDKDEILTLYLNEAYFGNRAYGIEAAARVYFGKPVAQLDLAESALLAGLPQAPGRYNSRMDRVAAKSRQTTVLRLMERAGYLEPHQVALASDEPLRFADSPWAFEAPHFFLRVGQELDHLVGEDAVRRGLLRVHTTLDLDLQRSVEKHVSHHLEVLNAPVDGAPPHGVRNAAVVVLDPQSGAIRALVGSPDYFDDLNKGSLDATAALRQPGSAIKPLTYAAAFEHGFSPATMIADERTAFVTREGLPYVPTNYDKQFHGSVSLREALASSYNVAAVKLLDRIGTEALPDMARRMGITSLDDTERYGLALTLGSGEVQLLQLASAYASFANGGFRTAPSMIEYVEDSSGRVLYQRGHTKPMRVLDERIAYLITDILADDDARVPAFGVGSVLDLPFPAAVKTGTTTEWRDNWTIGYSKEMVVGVWVGNANNEPMVRVSGVDGAAPIWNAVMQSAHRRAPEDFGRPDGLVEQVVCAESGRLPAAACTRHRAELFLPENLPTERCEMHPSMVARSTTRPSVGPQIAAELGSARPPANAGDSGQVLGPEDDPRTWSGYVPANVEPEAPSATVARQHDVASSVALSSPDHNTAYTLAPDLPLHFQRIEIAADCTACEGLVDMSLWIDGNKQHTWRMPPYRFFWTLTAGEHEFVVEAAFADLAPVRSAPVRIRVEAP